MIVAAAVISTGARAYWVTDFAVRLFVEKTSDFGKYEKSYEPDRSYDAGLEDGEEEPLHEGTDHSQAKEFQRIEMEMQAIAEYLRTEGALAGIEESDHADLTFSPELDAKGWPYAVVYREKTDIDGVKGYRVQTITYDYTRNYERQDEFVYEEDYYDENGNFVRDTQILDFFLVDRDTMKVTDEHTTEWGEHADGYAD